jgi:secreted trypsin-like serine protease
VSGGKCRAEGGPSQGGINTRRQAVMDGTHAIGWKLTIAACWLLLCVPAHSIVGGVPIADRLLARHAVLLFNRHGMCSGVVLAPDLVLTAAHCAELGKGGRIAGKPAVEVMDVAVHPQYVHGTQSVTPDIALLKLARPLPPPLVPAILNVRPVFEGENLFIVGFGKAERDEKRVSFMPRMAMLSVAEQSADLLMLTDPGHAGLMIADRSGKISGCDGDSGAPAFTMRGGVAAVAGVLSGSNRDCGGITYIIPTLTYLGWIRDTARNWGVAIDSR